MKEFDSESLSQFDGKEGRPVYIAHKGRVFDVSGSKIWKNGLHMKRHEAGRDLTADIEAAPHGPDVLDRHPQIGILKAKVASGRSIPEPLEALLERFPALRRHPHPALVHFPIAFAVSPTLFYLLYLITAVGAFETTAFHLVGAGLLFSVPGILTGFITWWLNYQARLLRPVRIKIVCSSLLVVFFLAALLLRVLLPDGVISFSGGGILYLLLILALIPTATVLGWQGAKLTFPTERG
jgi:predicted heme/steroid binding protein/uncharacterized membrane protein